MGLKVTNNAYAVLNASITSSSTTIVLVAGQGARFPTLSAGDYFYATLIDTSNNLEIVKVTARSTDTLTVVRGQDNTTARAYATNDRFELRPTAALFNEKANEADVASTYLPLTGGAISGNVRIGGDAFGQPLRRLTVREDATDSTFKGLKVVNAGGSGAVSGVYLQAYDWVQGGIWHGRTATGTERDGALVLGTNPNTSDLSEGGLIGRIVIDNAGRIRTPYQPAFQAVLNGNVSNPSSGTTRLTSWNKVSNGIINARDAGFSTANGRFTAPVSGLYLMGVHIDLSGGLSTGYYLSFGINGGNRNYDVVEDMTMGSNGGFYATRLIPLVSGDYVEVYMLGGAWTLNGSGNQWNTRWEGFLIG